MFKQTHKYLCLLSLILTTNTFSADDFLDKIFSRFKFSNDGSLDEDMKNLRQICKDSGAKEIKEERHNLDFSSKDRTISVEQRHINFIDQLNNALQKTKPDYIIHPQLHSQIAKFYDEHKTATFGITTKDKVPAEESSKYPNKYFLRIKELNTCIYHPLVLKEIEHPVVLTADQNFIKTLNAKLCEKGFQININQHVEISALYNEFNKSTFTFKIYTSEKLSNITHQTCAYDFYLVVKDATDKADATPTIHKIVPLTNLIILLPY